MQIGFADSGDYKLDDRLNSKLARHRPADRYRSTSLVPASQYRRIGQYSGSEPRPKQRMWGGCGGTENQPKGSPAKSYCI